MHSEVSEQTLLPHTSHLHNLHTLRPA